MVRSLLPYRSHPQDHAVFSPVVGAPPRKPAPIVTAPVHRYSSRSASPSPITTTPPRSPAPRPHSGADVHDAVARLLALTKQLQEVLLRWGARAASARQVSDAFVLVGAQFNTTVNLFWQHNVDMSDLFSLIGDLRGALETCLGEEPSAHALERHMPAVRRAVYNLLQGLRSKQQPYWADRRKSDHDARR